MSPLIWTSNKDHNFDNHPFGVDGAVSWRRVDGRQGRERSLASFLPVEKSRLLISPYPLIYHNILDYNII